MQDSTEIDDGNLSTESENLSGLDAHWHAAIGQSTGGLSPAALSTAYLDWSLHLIGSP